MLLFITAFVWYQGQLAIFCFSDSFVPTGFYDLYCIRKEYLFFMILKFACMLL